MGVFARMMERLAFEGGEEKVVMIDATSLKAHRPASSLRAKKGAGRPARPSDWAATFYKLKAKHGGIDVSAAQRLKTLEDENGKLKRLLADAMLDNIVLKDLPGKP